MRKKVKLGKKSSDEGKSQNKGKSSNEEKSEDEGKSSDGEKSANEGKSQNKNEPKLVIINLKKKPKYKSVQVTKNMTFNDLIKSIFPSSLPGDGNQFIIRSSLESLESDHPDEKDGINRIDYLPEQMLDDVFSEKQTEIWIDVKREDDLTDYFSISSISDNDEKITTVPK